MREARLNLVRSILDQFGPIYRKDRRSLNRAERVLYENALRLAVKDIVPRDLAKPALAEFDAEIAAQRARAEHARTVVQARRAPGMPDAGSFLTITRPGEEEKVS